MRLVIVAAAALSCLSITGLAHADKLAGGFVACPTDVMLKSYLKAGQNGDTGKMKKLMDGPCFTPPAGWMVEVIKRGSSMSRVLVDAGGGRKWDMWTPNSNIRH